MDHYIFDKRVMKKLFLKYGIMLFVLFILLIFVNTLIGIENSTAVIFIDMAIGLAYILVVEIVLSKIKQKKLEKSEEDKKNKTEEIVIEAEVVDKKNGNRQKTSKKGKK
ncbi:MAG: hypothetical protein E7361_01805 [Clostridiales bacterium]|nr:hypothetical protein [Clostridiales bacterium]